MDAELYTKCCALTKYALGLPGPLAVEELCHAEETCCFPEEIFPDAVEHARICFVLANYIASAFENNRDQVAKLKHILQRLATSSINNMTDNVHLDANGCVVFFSMISRLFKKHVNGEGFQICMYKDNLAYLRPDRYIMENRIAHVMLDFATQMLELIANLE